jgi:hypothetical protein
MGWKAIREGILGTPESSAKVVGDEVTRRAEEPTTHPLAGGPTLGSYALEET